MVQWHYGIWWWSKKVWGWLARNELIVNTSYSLSSLLLCTSLNTLIRSTWMLWWSHICDWFHCFWKQSNILQNSTWQPKQDGTHFRLFLFHVCMSNFIILSVLNSDGKSKVAMLQVMWNVLRWIRTAIKCIPNNWIVELVSFIIFDSRKRFAV